MTDDEYQQRLKMTPEQHVAWTVAKIAESVATLRGETAQDRAEIIADVYIRQLLSFLNVDLKNG